MRLPIVTLTVLRVVFKFLMTTLECESKTQLVREAYYVGCSESNLWWLVMQVGGGGWGWSHCFCTDEHRRSVGVEPRHKQGPASIYWFSDPWSSYCCHKNPTKCEMQQLHGFQRLNSTQQELTIWKFAVRAYGTKVMNKKAVGDWVC